MNTNKCEGLWAHMKRTLIGGGFRKCNMYGHTARFMIIRRMEKESEPFISLIQLVNEWSAAGSPKGNFSAIFILNHWCLNILFFFDSWPYLSDSWVTTSLRRTRIWWRKHRNRSIDPWQHSYVASRKRQFLGVFINAYGQRTEDCSLRGWTTRTSATIQWNCWSSSRDCKKKTTYWPRGRFGNSYRSRQSNF